MKKTLLDIIVDFIAKRKVNILTSVFTKNKKIVSAIEDLNKSYTAMEKNIEDYCKKYPEACKRAEEKRRAAGLDF